MSADPNLTRAGFMALTRKMSYLPGKKTANPFTLPGVSIFTRGAFQYPITQVSLAVRDLEKTMELYWRAFGWSEMDSIFLGAILSISSTTIIIKALEGLGKTRESFASLIFGILIVEDILAIVLIALLSGLAITGQFEAQAVGMTLLSLGSFLGILLVVGLILVPRLLNYVASFKSDEMLLITQQGMILRMQTNDVRAIGRATQGVKLIDIEGEDKVVSIAKLVEKEEEPV